MTVELDAADQLDGGDPIAGTVGILPQLSVLEMLIGQLFLVTAVAKVINAWTPKRWRGPDAPATPGPDDA